MQQRRDVFREILRQVIHHLARKEYLEIEKMTHGIRLREIEIDQAIKSYGRNLVVPEDSHFDLMDIVEVEDVDQRQWSVVIPLCTEEEGRSDLTLEATIIETGLNKYSLELDDIHVM